MELFEKSWPYRGVLWTCILCVSLFLVWAFFAQIQEQVRATGQIVPSGKARKIQHLEGGIVNDILIKEGQTVNRDDVLFQIENQRAESDLKELGIAIDALHIQRIRLEAEYAGKKEPVYPDNIDTKYPEIIITENRIFASRKSEARQTISVLEKQIHQKILKLDELESTAKQLDKELEVAQKQMAINTKLRKTGAISRSQYLGTVSDVRNFETRITRTRKEIPIVKSEVAELTSQIKEFEQRTLTQIGEDLNKVKVDIRKLKERGETFSDQVSRKAVRSPVDGVISEIYINTIGAIVQPGGFLAEIVPVNENLIVEGRITTEDRAKIWVGQDVVTNITAYDYTIYGSIKGQLTYVSANSFTDSNGQQYYQIEIVLDDVDMGDRFAIYAGMVAEVNILAGKVSILHAILKPFYNIRDNALREK